MREAERDLGHVSGVPALRPEEGGKPSAAGVNLVGFFDGEEGQGLSVRLGLGDVARRIARGLEAGCVQHVELPYLPARGMQPDFSAAPFGINIICLNADYIPTFAADAGPGFFAGRRSIGVWFWETSVFRAESLQSFRYLDEIWVASEYVRRVIATARPGFPVKVVPFPLEPTPAVAPSRDALGLPTGFLFLFVFDWVSAQRKNPTGVLESFMEAFAPEEGPHLLLKSVNGAERKPKHLEELRELAGDRTDVHLIDSYVPSDRRNALIATCDCYVSLHRSEGFGLTMAEAMSFGKPVIATGYSGNLDFMDADTAYLVPYRLVPVPSGWWAYTPGAEWAEPDVAVAATLMREVYERQPEAQARGERGRDELLRRFSIERSARAMLDRLEEVRGPKDSSEDGIDEAQRHLIEASELIARGVGASLGRSRGGGPTGLVRRLLVRALWPYLEDQHRLDEAMIEGVANLQRSVSRLERAVDGLRESVDRSAPGEDD